MNRTRSAVVFFSYALLVTVASLQPSAGAVIGPYDKAAHFVTYAIFALLAYRVTASGRQFWLVCTGIVVYSGLLEFAQSFVPGREMSALDLLANISGVVLGALLCQKVIGAGKCPAK